MVGIVPHPDDSESDWDSISQPVTAAKPDGKSTILTAHQTSSPSVNKEENAETNFSSDQENGATESASIQEHHEIYQYSSPNRDKHYKTLSETHSILSPANNDTVSIVRLTNENLHDIPVYDSHEGKMNPWKMLQKPSLKHEKQTIEQAIRLADMTDIEIQCEKEKQTEKKECYLPDSKNQRPYEAFDSVSEERAHAFINIASQHYGVDVIKRHEQANYDAYFDRPYAENKRDTFSKLAALPVSETDVQSSIDEETEIFRYERCNVEFHEGSKRTKSFSAAWNERAFHASNRMWTEITTLLEMPFLFLLAFILQLIRFITSGLLRPLTVGLLRGISDGLLKPILSVLHNGFLVPLAVFVHNISLALHTALVPIGSIITIGAEALSRLLQSCRLVEIHVNSEDLCNSYAKRGSRKGTKMPESV